MERHTQAVSNDVHVGRFEEGPNVFFRLLAHCVAVLHVLTILFFLFGGIASLLVPMLGLLHFPLAVWICVAFIRGWKCPLTGLENRLLKAGGSTGYDTTFTDRLLQAAKGRRNKPTDGSVQAGLGRQRERNLGIAFAVWNLIVYAGHVPAIYQAVVAA